MGGYTNLMDFIGITNKVLILKQSPSWLIKIKQWLDRPYKTIQSQVAPVWYGHILGYLGLACSSMAYLTTENTRGKPWKAPGVTIPWTKGTIQRYRWYHYPVVISHSYGTLPCLMGKPTKFLWPFSVANFWLCRVSTINPSYWAQPPPATARRRTAPAMAAVHRPHSTTNSMSFSRGAGISLEQRWWFTELASRKHRK